MEGGGALRPLAQVAAVAAASAKKKKDVTWYREKEDTDTHTSMFETFFQRFNVQKYFLICINTNISF